MARSNLGLQKNATGSSIDSRGEKKVKTEIKSFLLLHRDNEHVTNNDGNRVPTRYLRGHLHDWNRPPTRYHGGHMQ